MKLISCDSCGVVLDADKMYFDTQVMFDDEGDVRLDKAVWDGENYVPYLPCPCCGTNIKEDGEALITL